MATRTITIALEAKVGGLVSGFKTAQQAASDFGSKTEEFTAKNRESLEGVGKAGVVAGSLLVAGLGASAKAAMNWESAWTGVLKTVDGTPAQLSRVEDGLRGLAKELPASHQEIAAVAEAAGQLGIQTDSIVSFTKTMIDMGESTNLGAEQAATSLARFMNIMGTSQDDVGRLGSTLVGLGNNFATTESEIMDMTMRLAGAAKQIDLTEGQTMGLAAAMSSVGIEAEAGGSAMSLTMKRIGASVDSSDAKLGLFAKTAGMTGTQFQKAWKTDAAGALESFVIGLGKAGKQGESVNGILSELGITGIRESDALLRLSSAGELMGDSMKQGAREYDSGMALIEEANKRYETSEAKIQMAWNNIADAAIDAGAVLLPVVAAGAEGVAGLASAFGDLPAPVQGAITALGGVAGAGLLAAGGVAMLAPRVFETIGHFKALSTTSSGAITGIGKVGKAAGVAAVGFVALQVAAELAGSGIDDIGSSEEFETAIRALAKDADAGAKAIESFASATGSSLTEITGLGDALETVDLNGFLKGLDWVGSMGGIFDTEVGLAKAALESFDDSLAGLASGGNLEAAAEGFRYAAGEGEKVGKSVEKVSESFPGYIEALRELANETVGGVSETELLNWAMGETPPAMLAAAAASEETAAAIGEIGGEAEAAVVPLEDIVEALFALGVIAMSSRDSTAAFHDALREMHDATVAAGDGSLGLGAILNETATDFDLTTEAGAAANAAFQNIATAGMADVEAKAREGMGQPELQANLQLTYDSLVAAAHGMDIEGAAADDLAKKVMGIPPNADTQAYFHDAAAKLGISGLNTDLAGIPGQINVSVNVSTWGVAAAMQGIAGIAAAAANVGSVSKAPAAPWYAPKSPFGGAGGSGGFAIGGAVHGPGTGTSDTAGIFALSNGEHVLTASEVQAMGGQAAVYAFRAQLDAGVPASFSAPAREFSAPPAMNYGSGSNASSSIDYDRLAAAIESRPVIANLRIGNRDVAQANIQGRKELRLPTT